MKTIKYLLLTLLFFTPLSSFAKGIDEKINDTFMPIAEGWEGLVLTTIALGGYDIPLVVLLLVVGASFFTIYFSFPSITRFGLAINTVRGKYDELEGTDKEKNKINDEIGLSSDGDILDTIKDEIKLILYNNRTIINQEKR